MTGGYEPLADRIAAARRWAGRLGAAEVRERLDVLEERAARGLPAREAEAAFYGLVAELFERQEATFGRREAE